MKIVTIKHETLFSLVTDMLYDCVFTDGEPLELFDSWLKDLTTPERFIRAVTADCKAFTYFNCQLDELKDLDELASDFKNTGTDFIIVVTKSNKPWCSILFTQLKW